MVSQFTFKFWWNLQYLIVKMEFENFFQVKKLKLGNFFQFLLRIFWWNRNLLACVEKCFAKMSFCKGFLIRMWCVFTKQFLCSWIILMKSEIIESLNVVVNFIVSFHFFSFASWKNTRCFILHRHIDKYVCIL